MNEHAEVRKLVVNGDEVEFNVVVVDSPGKWPKAEDIKFKTTIDLGKKYTFDMQAISYAEWAYVSMTYPIPDATDAQNEEWDDNELALKAATAKDHRKVYFFEHALGKTIPGENIVEKIDYIHRLPGSLMDALFIEIQHKGCCLVRANDTEVYLRESAKLANTVAFDGFDSLIPDGSPDFVYATSHPDSDCIFEFPLRSITADARAALDKDFALPVPPMRPKRLPNGQLDRSQAVPYINEPHYQAKVRRIQTARMIKQFSLCLPFDIPGETPAGQSAWIGSLPMGDVSGLDFFINDNIITSFGDLHFF